MRCNILMYMEHVEVLISGAYASDWRNLSLWEPENLLHFKRFGSFHPREGVRTDGRLVAPK